MQNALLVGLSRQVALGRELDVVANNIANINTTGYKADGSVFEEYPDAARARRAFQSADQRLSYVQDRATWHDFSPGPIDPADRQSARCRHRRRRIPGGADGARRALYPQRRAADQRHRPARDQRRQPGARRRRADPVPEHRPRHLDQSRRHHHGARRHLENGFAARHLAAGRVRWRSNCRRTDSNLFAAPNGGHAAARAKASRVVQGSIEKSNVRGVIEMSRMIEITRTYTQIAGHAAAAERSQPVGDRQARRRSGLMIEESKHPCARSTPRRPG